MSETDELIQKYSKKSEVFKQAYQLEKKKTDASLLLKKLRKDQDLTQQELANLVGKPQSTIARIENCTMNPSFDLVVEIAEKVGKELEITFK